MKRSLTVAMALALTFAGGQMASAQPGRDHRDDRHDDRRGEQHDNGQHRGWHKGGRIEQSDWRRGRHLDYRAHHLRAPPRGYEWREIDGNYVLAAAATGLIYSLIAGGH
jgi:Ni/Co efflux regulator RcnB